MVLGLGKLGARELNFSSDVDLIFAYSGRRRNPRNATGRSIQRGILYPPVPQADPGHRPADAPTGFVFRVDLRLRPFGDNGPAGPELRRHGAATTRSRAATGSATPGSRRARSPATGRPGEELLAAPAAVRLPALPRLRRLRIPAGHEADDRPGGRPQGAAAGHQARAGRHPRDRVLRPDVPADPRRA
ncbi:MAG: hypothetical protein MZV70_40910 [Desulfobacterales bacterium]|nr:hypothetical protein [Desulfobacterales bacterium]